MLAFTSLAILAPLAISVSAQAPSLAEIPTCIAELQRSELKALESGLQQRRSDLMARISTHNGQCGVMDTSSSLYPSCASGQADLEKEIASYAASVEDFNRKIRIAMAESAAALDSNTVDLCDVKGPLIINPADLKTASREGFPITQPPAERLAELRRRVALIEQALIQLGKARENPADRAEWEDDIAEVSLSLPKHVAELDLDILTTFAATPFRQGLNSTIENFGNAAVKLAGETDPNRRKQLQAAMQMMREYRSEFTNTIAEVDHAAEQSQRAALVVETTDWAKEKDSDYQKSLGGIRALMGIAIGDKQLQKWMKLSPVYGNALSLASDTLDVGYDVTKGLLGAARIKQMNAADELYAQRVNDLSLQMKRSIDEMKGLEKKIRDQNK